jgi:thiol-disulfide isomerase/thioredoxin
VSNSPFRSFCVAPALAAVLGVFAADMTCAAPLTLKAGDPAPEFKVATWLKGTPVKQLERGNIYVLEFWATRCAPCIKALPHLKELSEQYKGKATFIAIGQPYERETLESIQEFVRRKDDLMPYAVGLEPLHGKGPRMYDQWGPPAGFAGLPVTIVVDGAGRIAWTGMPMELDEPLKQIVAGTHDIQAARRQQEADHAAADVNSAQRESFRTMLADKDYAAVIQRVDTLAARNPALEGEVYAYKLMALLETDPPEAIAYAQGLPPALRGDAASVLAERDGLPQAAYEFIAAELEKAVSNPDTHVMSWQLLASTYHRLGKLDRAIEIQQAALKKSDEMGYTEFSVQLRRKLEQYQAEKAKPGAMSPERSWPPT